MKITTHQSAFLGFAIIALSLSACGKQEPAAPISEEQASTIATPGPQTKTVSALSDVPAGTYRITEVASSYLYKIKNETYRAAFTDTPGEVGKLLADDSHVYHTYHNSSQDNVPNVQLQSIFLAKKITVNTDAVYMSDRVYYSPTLAGVGSEPTVNMRTLTDDENQKFKLTAHQYNSGHTHQVSEGKKKSTDTTYDTFISYEAKNLYIYHITTTPENSDEKTPSESTLITRIAYTLSSPETTPDATMLIWTSKP